MTDDHYTFHPLGPSAFGALDRTGRLAAVLYHDGARPCVDSHGEPVVAPAGWFLCWVDTPARDTALDAPLLTDDLTEAEQWEAAQEAIHEAEQLLRAVDQGYERERAREARTRTRHSAGHTSAEVQ
jgi:hypothetical protein